MLGRRHIESLEQAKLGLGGPNQAPELVVIGCGFDGPLPREFLQHQLGRAVYIHSLEPVAHHALDLERQDTDEDMRFNPPIHPVMHRSAIKRPLEGSETALDILQFLVLPY